MRLILTVFIMCFLSQSVFALDYSCIGGTPTVVDGQTLIIDEYTIHIDGIIAPRLDKICKDKKGNAYPCGEVSKQALEKWLNKSLPIRCCPNNYPFGKEEIATCFRDDDKDVGQYMVENGYAINHYGLRGSYKAEQKKAKRQKAGLWQGSFTMPWEELWQNW